MKTTYCKGCGEEVELRPDQSGVCDKCFTENEDAKRDYEAEKQYQDRNQHWDV